MDVPVELYSDLARFDGSITIDRTRGEMTVECDNEAANFLALNLAYDIINEDLGVEEARQRYARILRNHQQGQSHPYVQGFEFDVPTGNTGDPDQRVRGSGQ